MVRVPRPGGMDQRGPFDVTRNTLRTSVFRLRRVSLFVGLGDSVSAMLCFLESLEMSRNFSASSFSAQRPRKSGGVRISLGYTVATTAYRVPIPFVLQAPPHPLVVRPASVGNT